MLQFKNSYCFFSLALIVQIRNVYLIN